MDLGNSRFLRQVGRALSHVCVFFIALRYLYGCGANDFILNIPSNAFSLLF